MINNLLKRLIYYFYFDLFLKRIKPLIEAEDVKRLATSLKSVGVNFSVKYPHRIYNSKYIKIGDDFHSSEGLKIEAIDNYLGQEFTPEVTIGNHVVIVSNCHVACINKVSIGNNVLIASNVFISDHSHGTIEDLEVTVSPYKRLLVSKGPVIIEDNVWIGENVSILPGVTIGANSIIGANAVVTKNIVPNTVAAGNPAKPIKTLKTLNV